MVGISDRLDIDFHKTPSQFGPSQKVSFNQTIVIDFKEGEKNLYRQKKFSLNYLALRENSLTKLGGTQHNKAYPLK